MKTPVKSSRLKVFNKKQLSESFHKIFREAPVLLFRFISLSANPTKWSNTLKQFVGNLLANCLSVFKLFVELALKGLTTLQSYSLEPVTS